MAFDDLDISSAMIHARDTTGKSLFGIVWGLARLAWRRGMTPQEYFAYRLYDDRRFSFDEKARFLSDKSFAYYNREVSHREWLVCTRDKLISYAILGAYGMPIPRIYAVYHPVRVYPGARCLRTPDELADFLRDGMTYPFFQKPISGVQSREVSYVQSYDASDDVLVHLNGDREPVSDYVVRMGVSEGVGLESSHLWQQVIHPHPDVVALTGPRLNTVRVVVGMTAEGPEILGCAWKIAVGENVADNFWRDGNLIAGFDLETGEITRVVRGEGAGLEEVFHSPDTQAKLVGAVLPMWPEVRKLALEGAAIFPKIRLQGWDIALAAEGPLVVEVNTGSSFVMLQYVQRIGAIDARFGKVLDWGRARNQLDCVGPGFWERINRRLFGR